jgi:cation:H+ antiporter
MGSAVALPLFGASLAVMLVAARLFARRLDQLGSRFGFPEALVGLLTALAADGPEISSALVALVKGAHSVSVGVLVGSNAFNLAAMIGLSGLLAGCVRLSRATLLLEGSVGAAVTLIGAAVLLGWLSPALAAILGACAVVPYLLLVIGGSELLAHPRVANRFVGRMARALDQRFVGRLARALDQRPGHGGPPRESSSRDRTGESPPNPTHHLLALIVLDVALIVAGSVGVVQAALALGENWHISRAILGMLILGPLTSVPNAITAVRLGLAGRGAALVGETFNSNSLNLGAGVIVPALFVTLGALSGRAKLQLVWMVGMTCVCLLALARAPGIRRGEAAALVALYLGFVATQLISV